MTDYPYGIVSRTKVRLLWTWIWFKKLFKKRVYPKCNSNLNILRRLPDLLQDHELEDLIYWTVYEYKRRMNSDKELSKIYNELAKLKKDELNEWENINTEEEQ